MGITAAMGAMVVGGAVQAKGAKDAAKTQAEAAREAGNLEYAQYLQTRDDLREQQAKYETGAIEEAKAYDPYVQSGEQAAQRQQALSGLLGPEAQKQAYADYQESPGVAFQREQGMRGLEQNLNVGGVGGGTRLKALSRFNQNLAMQDFNQQYNRLSDQSLIGRQALSDQIQTRINALKGGVQTAGQVGAFGADAASARAQSINDAGAATAGGQLGQAQAIGGTIQSIGSLYGGGMGGGMGGTTTTPTRFQNSYPQSSGVGAQAPRASYF
jgi:hypothetical protein